MKRASLTRVGCDISAVFTVSTVAWQSSDHSTMFGKGPLVRTGRGAVIPLKCIIYFLSYPARPRNARTSNLVLGL